MLLLLQALGLLYACITWCEHTNDPAPLRFVPLVILRSASALLVFAAALLADEAARRGLAGVAGISGRFRVNDGRPVAA